MLDEIIEAVPSDGLFGVGRVASHPKAPRTAAPPPGEQAELEGRLVGERGMLV